MYSKNFKLLLTTLLATSITLVTTACASGGFKLTREYARFVNRQTLILRIVIYIFTSIVFAVTMLIDMVVFNTMDFWQGRVAAGSYNFNQDGKSFHVKHEVLPLNSRKRSTIEVRDADQKLLQVVTLEENAQGEIDLSVDGQLRTRVRDVNSLPVAAFYDAQGILTAEKTVLFDMPVTAVAGR